MGSAMSRKVVLGCAVKKLVEQAMRNKLVSHVLPWPLPQFLPPVPSLSLCPAFLSCQTIN